jgi:DNA-binding transcriptional LysR family regulator
MSLEVRHMRHVIALDEHGSFARAATALGLSQSALSRSIQSVEREIGSNLFVRTTSGVEPTDSGRVFIARIRQIAQLTEDLQRDLASERGRPVPRAVRARRRPRPVCRRLPAHRRARDDA